MGTGGKKGDGEESANNKSKCSAPLESSVGSRSIQAEGQTQAQDGPSVPSSQKLSGSKKNRVKRRSRQKNIKKDNRTIGEKPEYLRGGGEITVEAVAAADSDNKRNRKARPMTKETKNFLRSKGSGDSEGASGDPKKKDESADDEEKRRSKEEKKKRMRDILQKEKFKNKA